MNDEEILIILSCLGGLFFIQIYFLKQHLNSYKIITDQVMVTGNDLQVYSKDDCTER